MLSDKSLTFLTKAVNLSPENDKYRFALGKMYYSSGKLKMAEPLFLKICASDSLNWVYAYYLSDIYMQKSQFKKADSSGAAYALIFGADELNQNTVSVKSLRDGGGAQRTESLEKLDGWAQSLQSTS